VKESVSKEKAELLPIVFHWIKMAIINTKLSLAISLGVTLFAFYSVRRVDTAFLSSLVTLDGILIATMIFIIPFGMRLFHVERIIDSLTKAMRKRVGKPVVVKDDSYIRGFFTFLSLMVPATVSTALMLVSAAGMVPYFCSAILALLAMLKHGPISMGAAIIAFQLTLWEFLMTLQLIWMGTKFYWETTMNQEPPQELNPSMEKPKVHEKSKENLQANPSNSSTSV
jgi:hypothetical protein